MKTAIQNCADKILKIPTLSISDTAIIVNILAKAMDEEKQNLINAVTHGNRMDFYDGSETAGEQYYTSTFETNKETLNKLG